MSVTVTVRSLWASRAASATGGSVVVGRIGPQGATGATGASGPNSISDDTALGSLTDASADAPFLLAGNADGTFARKVTLGSVARSFLGATTQADARTSLGLGTVSTLSYPGGTTLYLRADGTWAAAAGGGSVASTDITDSTATGRAVLTAANAAAARTAIGAVIGTDVQAYDADLTSWAAVTRASGYDTFAATPSSANLAALLTDETGTGAAVFGTGPTLSGATLGGTTNATGGLIDLGSVANPWPLPPSQSGLRRFGSLTEIWSNNSYAANRAGACWIIGSSMRFGVSPDSTAGAQFGVTAEDVTLSRNAPGVWQMGTTANNALGSLLLTNLTASGLVTVGTYTVATLPSASANAGALAQVSDSNSTTNGTIVAGGGANRVPVFSDGTNWIVK